MSNPNLAAKRTARSMRSLSSAKRSEGSPIARIIPALRSSCPPTTSKMQLWQRIATLKCDRIEQQAIDREIAALHILGRIRREPNRIRSPSIRVRSIAAKRRDLCRDAPPVYLIDHQDHAEVRADSLRARKRLLHDIRSRRGRDVEVLRRAPEQQVAHATAGEIRSIAELPQTLRDCECGAVLRTVQASHGDFDAQPETTYHRGGPLVRWKECPTD